MANLAQKFSSSFIAVSLLLQVTLGGQLRCGDVLHAGEGKIQSPNHPGKYPSNVNCEWVITADYTNHITLVFTSFELEESPGCHYDYVEIYDGRNVNSPLLGKYCGMIQPHTLTSSSQAIFIKFISDLSIERLGFSVNYSTGCSRTFFGPTGQIMSPNYPSKYNINMDCIYKIIVGSRKRVKLIFIEFWLENGDARNNCEYDYVEVRDGRGGATNLLGTFCGNEAPGMLLSSANIMTLRFVSDASVVERGFLVEYQAEDDHRPNECENGNGGCAQLCHSDNRGRARCQCRNGYRLDADERSCIDVDECSQQYSCAQICTNLIGSYRCECRRGFHLSSNGKGCEDLNECARNNGDCDEDCYNTQGSYYCRCNSPGSQLQANRRSCSAPPSRSSCREDNGGCEQICHERGNGFYCSCHPGFTLNSDGFNCSDIDECLRPASRYNRYSHHCNQQCFNTHGSYYCDCDNGFELSPNGKVCKDINECATQLLFQCNQKCTNFPGSYRCDCFPGFQKDSRGRCEDINECLHASEDCHNCSNFDGGYECECREGYVQNENKTGCVDINECQIDNGGCQQVCVNLPGSHECRCRIGYQGRDLADKICVDIDECAADQRGPCDHFCSNSQGSFECTCRSGFYLQENRINCVDINECLDQNGGCIQDCNNIPGSWDCGCFEGFRQMDDVAAVCDDINECRDQVDHCAKSEGANCQNTFGNYTCTCQQGYETTDWTHCSDVNECANSTFNNCEQDCVNTNGSFSCACFEGYQAVNSTHCEDVDECDQNVCDHHDLCQNTVGSFLCACRVGFFLTSDQLSCSDINECEINNGGCDQICINDRGSRRCDCEVGYNLMSDEITCKDNDECSTEFACCNQMHNCLNLNGTYTCSCDAGFYILDDNCTCLDVNECEINNGGCDHDCSNFPGGYTCSCREGFESPDNDTKACLDIDECSERNGGCDDVCSNYDGGYNCSCGINFKLGVDGHTCRSCPTCENFEEIQLMVMDLHREILLLQQELTDVKSMNIIMDQRIRQLEETSLLPILGGKISGDLGSHILHTE